MCRGQVIRDREDVYVFIFQFETLPQVFGFWESVKFKFSLNIVDIFGDFGEVGGESRP